MPRNIRSFLKSALATMCLAGNGLIAILAALCLVFTLYTSPLAPSVAHADDHSCQNEEDERWEIDYSRSQLVFARFSGTGGAEDGEKSVAYRGGFQKFDADILFNPHNLDSVCVEVSADMTSLFTEHTDIIDMLRSPEWLDIDNFAAARFLSRSVRQIAPLRYMFDGVLTLRGLSAPISFDTRFGQNGGFVQVSGDAVMTDSAWRLMGPKPSDLTDETMIHFEIYAKPPAG